MASVRVSLDRCYRDLLVAGIKVYPAGEDEPAELVAAVDTGASSVVISVDVARRLGYAVDSAPGERVVTGRGAVYAPRITVARVDVGGACATEVETVCLDLPEEVLVDALVGLSFLTRFGLHFDFDAWEMELTPRA